MSKFDYDTARILDSQDVPFYALIQAAMRKADTENGDKLRVAFPETWVEMNKRYHAPGGWLPGDPGNPMDETL